MATSTSGHATSGSINLNWVCKLNLYCFNHPVVIMFTFVTANIQAVIYICKLSANYFIHICILVRIYLLMSYLHTNKIWLFVFNPMKTIENIHIWRNFVD